GRRGFGGKVGGGARLRALGDVVAAELLRPGGGGAHQRRRDEQREPTDERDGLPSRGNGPARFFDDPVFHDIDSSGLGRLRRPAPMAGDLSSAFDREACNRIEQCSVAGGRDGPWRLRPALTTGRRAAVGAGGRGG